jgi:RNA polymerase primary sigma factor
MATNTSQTGLGWYLDHIKTTPLLSAEQERQLSRRVREHSDPMAREQMIAANLRLVVKIAKDYSNPGMTLSDLVAEGNLGLMRAVEEFDPDAGVRFSTYAAWWIKQSIKRAMINAGQPIHIPAYLSKLIHKWRVASRQMEASLGRAPTNEELAERMGLSMKKVELVLEGLRAVSAPSQVGADESSALGEMLPDTNADIPVEAVVSASNQEFIQGLLEHLEPREQKILELRFGLDGYEGPPRTFKQIGEVIGLTRERVRQLEKKALASLKEVMDEV